MLFAINVPISTSIASMVRTDGATQSAPAMSCHEPATPESRDDGKPYPGAALKHLCCFTACIPLGATAEIAIVLALPVGDPLVTLLPARLMPRSIGVDPPPPKA